MRYLFGKNKISAERGGLYMKGYSFFYIFAFGI